MSKNKKFFLYLPIILIFLLSMFLIVNAVHAENETNASGKSAVHKQETKKSSSWAKYLAAAAAVAFGCISAGIAVSQVGSAAMGAISEKPELFGRALTFVGLSEGIAIWGLIIAILILYA